MKLTCAIPGLVVFAVACAHLQTIGAPLAMGSRAPGFELQDQNGSQVSLADVISDGPGVLVFYRGYW